MLILHIAIALLNHFGLTRAGADFATYQANTRAAERVVGINRNVFKLQRNVMLFTHTGSSGAARRVQQLVRRAFGATGRGTGHDHRETGGPGETYARLAELLDNYMAGFEQVKTDRARRRELAYAKMPRSRTAATRLLNKVAEEAWNRGDLHPAALAGQANGKLLESFGRRADLPAQPRQPSGSPTRCGFSASAASCWMSWPTRSRTRFCPGGWPGPRPLLPRYEQSLLKMVQTTRGYLHLVNVVMAGEAAEFVRYSDSFKQQTLDDLNQLAERMATESSRFKRISDAVSLATIFLGILAAWLIGRSVVPPLKAITHTLTRLARGESETEIPGLNRRDEIGEMAAAADVFREKSDETRDLLVASQKMGEELRDKNEEMERFAYTVSHDLKSPLVSCTGLLSFALEDLESGELDEVRSSIGRVQDNVRRMELCIQDLLDLSRIGRVRHEPETLDMAGLLIDDRRRPAAPGRRGGHRHHHPGRHGRGRGRSHPRSSSSSRT